MLIMLIVIDEYTYTIHNLNMLIELLSFRDLDDARYVSILDFGHAVHHPKTTKENIFINC